MHMTRSSRKRRRSGDEISSGKIEENLEELKATQEKILSSGWEAFREEYTESVEQLPLSLCRSFTLLAHLDVEANNCSSRLLPTIRRYLQMRKAIYSTPPSSQTADTNVLPSDRTRSSHQDNDSDNTTGGPLLARTNLVEITALLNEMLRTSEEKVNLAKATYDSVDRHVRLLDQAILEHESRFSSKGLPTSAEMQEALRPDSTIRGRGPRQATIRESWSQSLIQERTPRSVRLRRAPEGSMISRMGGLQTRRPYLDSDMPIDPHEPTYCTCNQVCYGDMVACDGEDCEGEWFHLACVGLREVPKQTHWFCEVCTEKAKSRRLTSRRKKH